MAHFNRSPLLEAQLEKYYFQGHTDTPNLNFQKGRGVTSSCGLPVLG